ncbi:hypothetical protein NPIL_451701 [Nephila pilipes]|uniref:Uncharacterized protein n=1 Tax=Nephila pilipes TaxID=299642 RepID=A0A8X6TFQ9_NEPPI|nr:hypothetical protein NPIL_451701 [Nephila pilipes]
MTLKPSPLRRCPLNQGICMIKISSAICRGLPCRKSGRILLGPGLKVLRSQPMTVMERRGKDHDRTTLFMKKIHHPDRHCGKT